MTVYRPIRRGITLIEMMVAMALALGIMLILTESFKMALDFVRGAHSTGELMSQLNSAGLLLTRDMQAEHFMDEGAAKPNGGKRLADQRIDQAGWTPPVGGFFRIVAPAVGVEQVDPQGFNINRPATPDPTSLPPSPLNPTTLNGNPSGGHALHFTVVMAGGGDASFTQNAGGTTYSSRAAEVAYFLSPMGKKTSVTAAGLPLYNLIRRQRLVAVTSDEETSLLPVAGDAEVISRKVTPAAGVNTMATVMEPANRMTLAPFGPGARFGEDIVVSNVLSFEVLADWTAATPANNSRPFSIPANTDGPYDFLNGVPAFPNGMFDTGGTTVSPPMPVRIKGLQITIRVYDPRVKTTRQNTWKFAM
jgi:type II secretory pathway pseudopilin PulG